MPKCKLDVRSFLTPPGWMLLLNLHFDIEKLSGMTENISTDTNINLISNIYQFIRKY